MEILKAIMRLSVALCLVLLSVPLAPRSTGAAPLRALETFPAENAVIDSRSDGFFVRFDRPIDHVHSVLLIKHGNQVVETLRPRLETAPEVLFARGRPATTRFTGWSERSPMPTSSKARFRSG